MLSVIIPTTSESEGLATARKTIGGMEKLGTKVEAVVVVDGFGRSCKEAVAGNLQVIRLEVLNGSYNARNVGAKATSGSLMLFQDSGTELNLDASFDPLDYEFTNTAFGGTVKFFTKPQTRHEIWYSIFAFDTENYIRKFNFIPTITLVVPRRIFENVGGFNSNLVSGGDVDFSTRLLKSGFNIALDKKITTITSLRNKKQLWKKLDRQVNSQSLLVFRKHSKLMYFLNMAARILYNLFGLNNLKRILIEKKYNKITLFVTNYEIGLKKIRILFECIFAGEVVLVRNSKIANFNEVEP